ncbi:27723_t:CDS:1, partial [Gigaspora margarita]
TTLINLSTNFCNFPKCSDNLIQSYVNSIFAVCATTDLQNNSLAQLIFAASVFYSPLHDSICFENKKSTFCWDEFARNLYGLPNSKHLVYASSDIFYGSCTLCSKAIVNTILNFIPTNHFAQLIISKMNIDISVIKNSISVICGNSFV